MCRSQPVVVLRFQLPCEYAAQVVRAFPKREPFGTARFAELFLDECDALAGAAFVRGRQMIRPRRSQHRLETRAQLLTLLKAEAHPRIQLSELRVDLGQQRLVVLFA